MPDAETAIMPLTVGDLLAILRRRRIAALAGLLAALAAGSAALLLHTPLYRATAELSVNRSLKPVEFQADPSVWTVQDQLVSTQRELLLSRDVLAEALSSIGLDQEPPYAEAGDALELMARRLQATVVNGSWVVAATYLDEDARRAERILEAVIAANANAQTRRHRESTARAVAFLEGQVATAAAALDQAQNRERQFRTEHGITSTDPEASPLARRLAALAQRKAELEDQMAASDALLRQLRGADAIADGAMRREALLRIERIARTPAVDALQRDINQLEASRAQLAEKYLERHPRMLEVEGQLRARRGQLDDALAQARAALETEHQGLTDQREALGRTIAEAGRELSAYREDLLRYEQLARESQGQAAIYQQLLARLAQERVTGRLDREQLEVVSRPHADSRPAGLARAVIALATVVGAVLAAAGAAVSAELLDPRLGDAAAALRRRRIPLLGALPRQRHLPPLAAGAAAQPPALAEAVRHLRARLLALLGEGPAGQVLAIASPSRGDGRTSLAARLGAALAAGGLRVLVVDGDLRAPRLAAELGLAAGPGLCELLQGVPELSPAATPLPNLEAMPAGDVAGYAPELLHSHCLGEWLGFVRARFDLVLLDTPPLAEGADAMVLAGHADRVLLALRPGWTRHRELEDGLADLDPARLLGAVLLQADGE